MERNAIVSVNTVKEFTNIDSNVDNDTILHTIWLAQDLYLETLIGYSLMNKIWNCNGIFVEPYTSLVFHQIMPYILKVIEYEITIKLWMPATSQGIAKNNNSDYENATIEEIKFVERRFKNAITSYGNKIIKYLNYHVTDIPEYAEIVNGQTNATANTMDQIYISPEVQAYAKSL